VSTARLRALCRTVIRVACAFAPRGVLLPADILRLTTAGRSACSARKFVAGVAS